MIEILLDRTGPLAVRRRQQARLGAGPGTRHEQGFFSGNLRAGLDTLHANRPAELQKNLARDDQTFGRADTSVCSLGRDNLWFHTMVLAIRRVCVGGQRAGMGGILPNGRW